MNVLRRAAGLMVTLGLIAGLSHGASARDVHEVVVFDDDLDGHADEIRIPAVVRAPDGSLLAFAERRIFGGDHPDKCDIDIVMKRSTNGGHNWSSIRTLAGISDAEYAGTTYDRYNSYHNPTPVVDHRNGRIYLFFNLSFSERNQHIDPPGIKDRILMRYSNDNGESWSAIRDLTGDLLPAGADDHHFNFHFGPGHGVTVQAFDSEYLVVPMRYRDGGKFIGFVYKEATASTTGWRTAQKFFRDQDGGVDEVAIATIGNEENLYFNMRDQRGGGYRKVGTLDNANHTVRWWEGPREVFEPAVDGMLVDPVVHGSLLRALSRFEGDDEDMMLFANPATKPIADSNGDRRFLTIRRSLSETATTVRWSENKLLTDRYSAYSDMVKIDTNTNGILYETGQANPYETIVFTRFTNAWVKSPRIAHWMFDGLSEGSHGNGTRIVNQETLAFDGFVWGKVRAADGHLSFGADDFANGYVQITNQDSNNRFNIDAGESFEIRARVRTLHHDAGGPSRSGSILAKDSGSPDKPAWWLRVRDGRVQFYVCDGTLERSVDSGVPVSDHAWHTISAKRDAASNELVLTVDGVTRRVSDGTGSLRNDQHVRIGAFNNHDRQFRGDMQYVQFYFYK